MSTNISPLDGVESKRYATIHFVHDYYRSASIKIHNTYEDALD
jgi:hypothetical protein